MDDLVKSVIDKFQLEKKRADSEVFLVWPRVVDPHIAQHARPVGLRNGTLFVAVDSPVWLEEIVRFHRHNILKAIQSAFSRSEIKKISFRCSG
jgi:predicted nucleic acid-binding Zn ribbon protein